MIELLIRYVVLIALKIVEALCFVLSLLQYFEKPIKCPPIKDEILLYPASILTQKIRNRELTSESVIRAYIARVKAVNPVLNAVVEDRFDLAINEAKRVDQMILNTNGNLEEIMQKYPLLGVLLTVKESIAVEGLSHCAGKILPDGKKAMKDAEIVILCKQAGAIPILVSNTPEMCVNYETNNKVTGRTNNPYDTRRTPGGSSGGEAALLGAGASVIGLGSDILGSLRLPAHYCGVWGHKPSSNAVSSDGHYPDCKDRINWNQVFTLGPMCRYAVDLPLILNVLLKENVKPLLQLYKEVALSDIQIYFMEDDGGSLITHTIDNEILVAMKKLISQMKTKHACSVQKLRMETFKYSSELSFTKILSIEDVEVVFEDENSFGELLRYITCKSNSVFSTILTGMFKRVSRLLPKTVVPHCNQIITHMKSDLCRILGTNGVLIYPSHPKTAHIHGQIYGRIFDYSYLGIFNCLELPVTNCPLGLNSNGLPFGIQIVAGPNNDRLTIAVAQEIERMFGGWIPPPCTP